MYISELSLSEHFESTQLDLSQPLLQDSIKNNFFISLHTVPLSIHLSFIKLSNKLLSLQDGLFSCLSLPQSPSLLQIICLQMEADY